MPRATKKTTKKKAPKKQGRTFETIVQACAHNVTVRWWDIKGPVTDEELTEAAEERIRRCLADDYHSGDLSYETDGAYARGWWQI